MHGLLGPIPLLLAGGGFPVVTLTAAKIHPLDWYGYAASGGWLHGFDGLSGGSLSATLYPGLTTTDVLMESEDDYSVVAFSGSVVSMVSGITGIKINGIEYARTSAPATENGTTKIEFECPSSPGTGSYTVQLVRA